MVTKYNIDFTSLFARANIDMYVNKRCYVGTDLLNGYCFFFKKLKRFYKVQLFKNYVSILFIISFLHI